MTAAPLLTNDAARAALRQLPCAEFANARSVFLCLVQALSHASQANQDSKQRHRLSNEKRLQKHAWCSNLPTFPRHSPDIVRHAVSHLLYIRFSMPDISPDIPS